MGKTDGCNGSLFAAARAAQGVNQITAAKTADLSEASYVGREKTPGQFRLIELKRLFKSYGPNSQRILLEAIKAFFLA